METYYLNDPRIEEWTEQIFEKVYSSCLLTGVDSDTEYQRGCQVVTKIMSFLQGFSTFPSEYLEDGLKQILEQQLPDSDVINNFPAFQDTMNKMLHEGMLMVIDAQNIEGSNTLVAPSKENICEKHIDYFDILKGNPVEELTGEQEVKFEIAVENVANEELLTESMKTEVASVNYTVQEKYIFDGRELAEAMEPIPALASFKQKEVVIEKIDTQIAEPINTDISSSIEQKAIINNQGELHTTKAHDKAVRLKEVLSYLFPNETVEWNISLLGHKFLVRVDDILICLDDPVHPCQTEKFKKNGWRIMMYQKEDLVYPRRFERKIKNIMRLGKKFRER